VDVHFGDEVGTQRTMGKPPFLAHQMPMCVCYSSLGMNLVVPAVHLAFYSSRSGGYTVTQGPTGGPRAEKILYCI
jgi:hypothetical protein